MCTYTRSITANSMFAPALKPSKFHSITSKIPPSNITIQPWQNWPEVLMESRWLLLFKFLQNFPGQFFNCRHAQVCLFHKLPEWFLSFFLSFFLSNDAPWGLIAWIYDRQKKYARVCLTLDEAFGPGGTITRKEDLPRRKEIWSCMLQTYSIDSESFALCLILVTRDSFQRHCTG